MPRRRRSGRRTAAAGEAADVVMDSGRNSDYVERLASKYMRKCKVESSTDSESDNINEEFGTNVPIPTCQVDVKTMDFQKLQFLDPYDGDSEDTIPSNSSELEHKCISDVAEDPCTLRGDSVGMDYGLISISDPQCETLNLFPYCNQLDKVKTPWQCLAVSEKSNKNLAIVPCSSDLSTDSSLVTDNTGVASSSFFMVGLDSTVDTLTSPVLPTSLTSEENSDFCMFETSLMKRKAGMRIEAEKMRRKKPRVMEYMQM